MSADNAEKVNHWVTGKQRINQVFALLWMILGVIFVIQSRNVEYWSEYGPGPGFLPFWIGVGFFFVGLLVLVQFTFGAQKKGDITLPGKVAARQMILVMVAFFGLALLGEKVGFILCIGLLFFFLLTVVEKKGWKFSLAIAILNVIVFWAIFEYAFGLRFPPGLLALLR